MDFKNLYGLSPEGIYVVSPLGVQLRYLSIYWVRKGILDFKNLKDLSRLIDFMMYK